LTSFKDKFGLTTWKGHDWQVMNSLHKKSYISNPAAKAKSVALAEEGAKLSQELFEKRFAMKCGPLILIKARPRFVPGLGVGTAHVRQGVLIGTWLAEQTQLSLVILL
jgi:hypothetical protein